MSEQGVSQRGVKTCLSEMLDASVSLGWINGELADLEDVAQQVNQRLEPASNETLAGDEIFANGLPNLLVVGNDSLYIYALTRQDERDGDTWGCVLLDVPETRQFASDAGTGLAAGVKAGRIESPSIGLGPLAASHVGSSNPLGRASLRRPDQSGRTRSDL
ncbi:MAG: hypothetical protein IPM39_12755 [Chloroflexi bacterium]|nr:hypothetical protein [Chloroflexota bacterium]